jgi:Domain of unknown function (DUF4476)
MVHFISKLTTTVFFSLTVFLYAGAQQNHFIYLQTENKQPFYAKLDKKIFSSSASGYLIIPKLQNGIYTLTLGFPKSEWSEQVITCSIDKKDAGYILKNFGDRGWGLFNWQTMNVVMAEKKMEDPVTAKPSEPLPAKTEPAITEIVKQPSLNETPKQEPLVSLSLVKKLTSNKTAEGLDMVYLDNVNGITDTIRLFIAVKTTESKPVINETKVTEVKQEAAKSDEATVVKKEVNTELPAIVTEIKNNKQEVSPTLKTEPPVLPVSNKPAVAQNPPAAPVVITPVVKSPIPNSDCKELATADDFMKLRKKMAAENNDDDMVHAAQKNLKAKCFTVEQIKNLSVLFLNDNGRYKFLDAAYPFVSDSYNFSSLQTLLTDEYYITRFKAMLRR